MNELVVIAVFACLSGCTQMSGIETGSGAEYTHDELLRINNSRFKDAWVDLDVDLTQYDKIMIGEADFEVHAVKKSSSTARRWLLIQGGNE